MTVIESECISTSGNHQFVFSQPRVHEQRVTVHHWQLRDLVLAPADDPSMHKLIVPSGQDVILYDYRTQQKSYLIRDLGFPPACMTVGNGYWAAGSQRGDVTTMKLDDGMRGHITTSLNHTINNGLQFANFRNGQLYLCVSNNDATVRIYHVPSMELVKTLDFRTAINHTSVSPDGSKMVCVGDDNKVYLFAITGSDTLDFPLVATMAVAKDANFSVSWNHTSDKFAVASQDGSVHVWETRSKRPLYKFGGNPTTITRGATRCVKFSQSGVADLLAYTEHVSHVHIIDARTFDNEQTLRVGPTGQDTPITGLAFSADSQNMFVGLENVVLEYDVDTGYRRRFPEGSLL